MPVLPVLASREHDMMFFGCPQSVAQDMHAPRCIVGLDLSIAATGITRGGGMPETIKTEPGDVIEARIDRIVVAIWERLIDRSPYTPDCRFADLVVIEEVPPIRAHSIAPLAMLHGALRLELYRFGIPFVLVPPATLKKYATGKGTAKKPDMRMALYKRTNLDLDDDNQVDAWWLRAMAVDHYRGEGPNMPKANREALEKIAWPEANT